MGHGLNGFLNLNRCERLPGGQAGALHMYKSCKTEITTDREERSTDSTCNVDVKVEKSFT